MAVTSPRSTNLGFFRNSGQANEVMSNQNKLSVVDVGGKSDGVFRAIAAGLIHHFLSNPRGYSDLLNKVLNSHFDYFPAHKPTLPGLSTAAERTHQLIKNVRMSELLSSLAFTLRQITITEWCAHPELYRGVFVGRNEHVAPTEMRKPAAWIEHSHVPAALANALAMPIEIREQGRTKTLAMRLPYHTPDNTLEPVVLVREGGQYKACVSDSERFAAVGSHVARELHPAEDALPKDRSLADIHEDIAVADKDLIHVFDSVCHRLATMVKAGELSKDDLMRAYIHGLNNNEQAFDHAKVGCENGWQRYLDSILSTHHDVREGVLPAGAPDKQMVDELVYALSGAVSVGMMKEADLFAELEQTSEVGFSR